MEIYFVRHGETEFNAKGVYFGVTDCSLNSSGLEQSKILADRLKNIKFDLIISSSLKRTIETANIINKGRNIEVKAYKSLNEMNFGKWEGMHYSDIQTDFKEEWNEWVNNWKKAYATGGENFEEFYKRIEMWTEEVLYNLNLDKLLIVGHNGVLKAILSILLNMQDKLYWNFNFMHGRYSVVEVCEGHCTIKSINDIM